MSDIRACGIVCPTDWVPLPVDPGDDLKSWVKRTAVDLCERSKASGYELDGQALREDLRDRAKDSRSRDPFYAFALYPDGFDSSLAVMELDFIHPDETVPEITLDWLASTFSAQDFGPPRIEHIHLPVGPAVRIRQDFAAADAASTAPEVPGVLLETITYGILPVGAEVAVMLLMSWTVPGVAAEMEQAADAAVRTVTVDF
ncbi:hypothetical protein ACGFZL_06340 [Streptomyces sp. NPDC048182]|uniref:hypothetical protein n=1 Tax=Streptomyces sp. NPDC048182 TaxID=3365507 RepID=UPI0037188241